MLRTIIVILFAGISLNGYTGDTLSVSFVNQKTYEYYISAQWDDLINLGKLAEQNSINFFYLKLRLGTAYFNKQRYRVAAKYFEKALIDNANYDYALEMLYYCYLYTNDKINLKKLMSRMDSSVLEKLKSQNKPALNQVYIQGGLVPSINQYGTNYNTSYAMEQLELENQKFASAGMSFFLNRRLQIGVGYTTIVTGSSYRQLINSEEVALQIKPKQFQYYLKGTVGFGRCFEFTAAAHLIKVNTTLAGIYAVNDDIETITNYAYDTLINAVPVHVNVEDKTFNFQHRAIESFNYSKNLNDYSVYAGLKYKRSYFDLTLSGVYSSLSSGKQYQGGLGITLYPFANLNTYSQTNIDYIDRNYNYNDLQSNNLVVSQLVGQKLYPFLWIEASYNRGNKKDFVSMQGVVVNNSSFQITDNLGVNLVIPIKNMSFTLSYNYQWRESVVSSYNRENTGTYKMNGEMTYTSSWRDTWNGPMRFSTEVIPYSKQTESIEYVKTEETKRINNHLIMGGLQWKF